MFRKILFVLIAILLGIQFFRPEKNISSGASADAIQTVFTVPDDVQTVLNKACRDCHSNQSTYPWYFSIQPVAWWIDHHIDEGKSELNFDAFATYSPKKQHHKMEEIVEQVKSEEMPLQSYTWTHRDARLTMEERVVLTNWASLLQKKIAEKHQLPEDKK